MEMFKSSTIGRLVYGILRPTLYVLVGLVAVAAICLAIFRAGFVTYVEQHELPYKFDRITGKVERLPKTGYIVAWPFVTEVYGIDLRPRQVLLQVGYAGRGGSANSRVLNAKLVQFNADGLEEFIKLHGLQEGDVSEILKIYAFDQEKREYPFLKVEASTTSSK